MKPVRIGDFMHRVKDTVLIDDNTKYKRVTIKTKNQGVLLRDEALGSTIGTKSQFRVRANQFILSKIDARWGAFGVVPNEVDNGIITGNFWTYEVDYEQVNINWLNLFTSSEFFIKICRNASTGVTNRQYLDEKFFLKYKVLLPSITEQDKIAARLQDLQALHRKAETTFTRLKADVKRLRQSILQDAIQGKLVDYTPVPGEKTGAELLADIRAEKERRARAAGKKPDAPLPPVTMKEMPFEVPEGWVWCRLGQVLEIVSGVQKGKAYQVNTFEIPYLRVANVQRGWLELHEIKTIPVSQDDFERLLLKKRDILMTEGGDPDKLGRCAIWNEEIETCVHQNHIFRGRIILPEQNEFYLMSLLNSPYAIKYFLRKFKQMTNLASVSKSDLSNLPIPLPPISIQNLILKDFETRQAQSNKLDQQLAALQAKTERLWKSELQQTFKFESA